MSVRSEEQKDLVAQRLVAAADEIFALFERTCADCEEEVLRATFLHQPRDVLHKQDFKDIESSMSPSMMISVKTQALKDQVVERLVVAADEIFVLFERTLSQYEEEVLQSKYLQQPGEVFHKEDVQTVIVGLNVSTGQVMKQEPIKIEQEPIEIPFHPPLTLKSEEPDSAEEMKSEQMEQCDEEPGCSSGLTLDNNKQPYSDTDPDEVAEKTTHTNAKEHNVSLIKDSAVNDVNRKNRFSKNTHTSTNTTSKTNGKGENTNKVPKCNLCYKTFKSFQSLDRHLEFHPGPFTCKICNKSYSDKSNYNKHLRIHSEEKPFKCPVCKRGFTQKRHMHEHMRIHTGEKPLSCSQCGMTFRHKNSLMRHVLSKHSDDKPHSCPVCLKGFVQKWHLSLHMRAHTGERPFSCSFCGLTFDSNRYLKRHVQRYHKDGEIINVVAESMDPESEVLWGLEPLCPGPQPPLLDTADGCI